MATLIIQPRSRVFHGHHWVMAHEVKSRSYDPQIGEIVNLKDVRGRMLGSAIYNPRSQIVARRFSYSKTRLDQEYFRARLDRARDLRQQQGMDLNLCRLLWSESDGVPGVVVDKYQDHIVMQTLTHAMGTREELIRDALIEVFQPASISTRNEGSVRAIEQLPQEKKLLHGELPAPFSIRYAGMCFQIDVVEGQKTGMYLDQLDNYRAVGALAKGRRVMDVFSNQGGFAQACALGGAVETLAIDASEHALSQLRTNAATAGLSIRTECANAFDFLKAADAAEQRWDMIILDPPSFAKNKGSVNEAMRGYKEIHLRALKMLEPGGILVTFSCSHHVSTGDFLDSVNDAAVDAKRTLRMLHRYFQRADHPVLMGMPETEYLRGYAFGVAAAW